MKNVLIVDADLGFVFWLGRVLADAGYQALPAKGFSEASALLSELKAEIDVLILNTSLPGAADFVKAFRRSRPNTNILAAFSNKSESESQTQIADIVARKPLQLDGAAGTVWVGMVKQALGVLAHRSGSI
jgi:DNA-binding response OmpR family regulator